LRSNVAGQGVGVKKAYIGDTTEDIVRETMPPKEGLGWGVLYARIER